MISPNHHIIRRQVIELDLPTRKDAYRQQQHVSQLFQQVVARRLGDYFDSLGLGDTVLRIPQLDIDLGTISPHSFDREFTEQCTLAIQQAVDKALRQANLASTEVVGDFTGVGISLRQPYCCSQLTVSGWRYNSFYKLALYPPVGSN